MDSFDGKIAVVTGGGSGIGRELVLQLAAQGCEVATCDLSADQLDETVHLATSAPGAPHVHVSSHVCDVSDQDAMVAFSEAVRTQHQADHVDLVVNNAGLSGGGSLFLDSRSSWDRCFDVCFSGVRYGTLAFLDLLVASEDSHLVNVASVNGLWATLGPDRPHSAYSTAKFAVRGFTEALITDLAVHAPHVGVSVVMPGHVGTSIVANSMRHGADQVDPEVAPAMHELSDMFKETAPTTAASAARTILDGVLQRRWRILVGDDARAIDEAIRADPESAYDGRSLFDFAGTPELTLAVPDPSGV